MSKTCRTCLIEILDTTYCILNKKDVKSKIVRAELQACVPELQLDLVKDPVICRNCVNILQLAYRFKTRCLLTEKRIQSCLRSAKLNGNPITSTKLFRFSAVRKSDVSTNPTAGESFPPQPRRASLDIEAVNDEHERTNDYRTSTANKGFNVMNHKVSLVDGEEENDLQNIVITNIRGSTVQPLEFQDKIFGWSSAAVCTDIVSQELDNSMDDFVKEEHELLTFKTEADEASSLKTELANDEQRSNCYKTVNLSEVSNLIDGVVNEKTQSVACEADVNGVVDEEYEFPVDIVADNDEHKRSVNYRAYTANKDFNGMNSDVSMLDGEEEYEIRDFVTNGGANMELTLQPLKFQENSLKSSSTPTVIMGEISPDFQNEIDDGFVKEEHELTFKTETDEALSFKEGNSNNNDEESSNDSKTDIWDDVKEETRSNTDDAEGNNCGTSSLYKDNNSYTISEDEPLNEKQIKDCTVDMGFSIKECFVNLQRLHLGDLANKSSFNTNDLLNLTSAKSLQTTNIKPESVRRTGSRNLNEQARCSKKSFCCKVCKYSTPVKRVLIKHMRIHTDEKPLQSNVYDFRAARKHNLIRHTTKKLFQCNVCDYSTARKQSLINHKKSPSCEKTFQCNVCEYNAAGKQTLIDHMQTHTGEKPFQCNVCDYKAVRKQSLIYHMRNHTGEKPFQCNVCEYSAARKQSLIIHMRYHTGEKQFQCNVCNYSAVEKKTLMIHMRSHTGEKPFQCNVCEYSAIHKQNLMVHLRTHTGEKPFQCNVCDYSAVHKQSLIIHMRTHTGEKPFQCQICEYSAAQKQTLIEHVRTHTGEKPFKCNVCEYSAVQKQKLIRHMQTHTGEKPFKCNVCEYSAIHKQNLIVHLRTHTGEKPFQCNVCDYSATHKKHVIVHMRTHTGEKPFQCNVCEYSAVHKQNLIAHMRTHTGEKPFQCNVCEYSTTQKQRLITHIRIHTGEKPFQCNVCEYSATLKKM